MVLTGPFAAGLAARFRQDLRGGSRSLRNAQALRELPEHWLVGAGPSRYVTEIGYLDPVTGRGLPVHNSALLVLLQLGGVGAALPSV